MTEIEAKFLLEDPEQAGQLIEALRSGDQQVRELPPLEVVDRYLDTPDWGVLREGWAYRWREVGGSRKESLKAIGRREGAIHRREEVEEEVSAFPKNGYRARGNVARKLANLNGADLRELFRVRNHRRPFEILGEDGVSIEVVFDQTVITATAPAEKRAPGQLEFEELELELKTGSEESLQALTSRLQKEFGLLPSRLSKFERGLHTAGLVPPPQLRPEVQWLKKLGCFKKPRERLNKDDPAGRYAWHYLLDQFEAMLTEAPKAWEGLDPEGVHRMRVATRRTRAGLHSFKSVIPKHDQKKFNAELKWIAGVLGTVRDPDVLQENFHHYASAIPEEDGDCLRNYQAHLRQRWQTARKELLACLSSDRYKTFENEFAAFLEGLATVEKLEDAGVKSIGEEALESIGKHSKRALRMGRAITNESPDEELHELRLACKRMRYRIEVFRPIYGASLDELTKQMKEFQNVLGEFQDACVATRHLREYAAKVPVRAARRDELLALGQLIHRGRVLAATHRAHFSGAWERFDQKGRKKEILALLR